MLLEKITEPDGSHHIIFKGDHFHTALGSELPDHFQAYGYPELLHAAFGLMGRGDVFLKSGGAGLPQAVKFGLVLHVSGSPLNNI